MNNFLLTIAGLIIAVFAVAFAIPYFVNWNDYRSEIEHQTSLFIGREVKIDGDIKLSLLPSPFLKLKQVRILDTFPGAKKPFVTVHKFTIWLSPSSLLSGHIQARKMGLVSPVINFMVDARGRGNWEEFKKSDTAGYDINNIALQDVTIEKGRIILHSLVEQGNEIFRTPFLNGEMSAASLSGPYKFKGELDRQDGARNSLRFSTGRSDDKKGMPVKAFLQNLTTKATYKFDSTLKVVENGKLSYQGNVIAKIPFERLFLSKEAQFKARNNAQKEPLEINAVLKGTATQARLNNIIFSLVRKNRPQALKGDVQLDWSHGDLQAIGNFQSRLLNIDLMGGSQKSGFNVAGLLEQLPESLYKASHSFHRADFTLKLDQVQVGGEMIRDLETTLSKTKTDLQISDLSAKLPAGSYLNLSGKIEKTSAQKAQFSGPLLIQGKNIGLLKDWVSSSKGSDMHKPFIFASQVVAGKGAVRLNDIDADIDGSSVRGELVQKSGDQQGLQVKLNFLTMDSATLFGKKQSLEQLVNGLIQGKEKESDVFKIKNQTLADLEKNKAYIKVRVGALELSDTKLNDFRVELDYRTDDSPLKELSFITKEGLRVVLDGGVKSAKMKEGQSVNLRLESLQPSAISQLAKYFNFSGSLLGNDKRLVQLHPLELNINVSAEKGDKGQKVLANGQAGGSEIFSYGYIKGHGSDDKPTLFATSDINLNISIRNPDGHELLKTFITDLALENMTVIKKGEGSINIQLAGIPEKGLQTEFYGMLPGLKLKASGEIRKHEKEETFAGTIKLEAENMSQGLALLGLGIQAKPDAGGLFLEGALKVENNHYHMSDMSGKIGQSDIYGSAELDRSKEKPVLNLVLTAQNASLVSILEPGIDWFRKEEGKATETGNIWSGKRFDLALLRGFEGRLQLKTKSLEIDQGLMVRDAVLDAHYGGGQLEIKQLSGKAFGGMVQTVMTIKHGRAVSHVKGKIEVINANLEDIFPEQSNALATGKANLSLNFSGSGLTPKGIVNLIKGEGNLQIIDTQFNYLAPTALAQIAFEEMKGTKEAGKTFEQRFADFLSDGQFNAGTKRFDIKLRDGIIRLKTKKLVDGEMKLSINNYVALSDLTVDSEWKLKAGKKTKPKNLPPAILNFAGKLASIGEIKPTYKLKALQSFLSVSKIEMDVKRLEDINSKLQKAADAEQKAREEQEKRHKKVGEGAAVQNMSGGIEMSPLEELPNNLPASEGIKIEKLEELQPAG